GRDNMCDAAGKDVLGRMIEPTGTGASAQIRYLAIPEDIGRAKPLVEQRGRISRNELATGTRRPRGPDSRATGPHRQRQAVPAVQRRLVTGGAGDIAVAAQDLVEYQRLAECHESGILLGHGAD